jgi:hypothetical protein
MKSLEVLKDRAAPNSVEARLTVSIQRSEVGRAQRNCPWNL